MDHIFVQPPRTRALVQALAPIHAWAVRTAVWAGMYVLPTRDTFMLQVLCCCHPACCTRQPTAASLTAPASPALLLQIGETNESARELGLQFLEDAKVGVRVGKAGCTEPPTRMCARAAAASPACAGGGGACDAAV
jgi:hypothetical protein